MRTWHWIIWFFFPGLAFAKDLGVHGHSFSIAEPDFLTFIENKLKRLEADGTLAALEETWQKKAEERLHHLPAVNGITETTTYSSRVFDPSITLGRDIHDHQHRIMHKAGTHINPLTYRNLSKHWIFFDARDKTQTAWAKKHYTEGKVLLIAIAGDPIALSGKWGHPVFYDQHGYITRRLKITHVPTVVSGEEQHLKIEEVPVSMAFPINSNMDSTIKEVPHAP